MKKKLALLLLTLAFGCGILFVSAWRAVSSAKPSLAAASVKFEVLSETTPLLTPAPKVEYYLVYPGILPDHPLYKIKAVRDRIWLWLTTDLVKKSELLLLYADKRIGASKVLIEGNKIDLGISTVWKAEKYLEQAAEKAKEPKDNSLAKEQLKNRLEKASLKHEEILIELKEKVNPEAKSKIEEVLRFLREIQKRVDSL